MKLKIMDSFFSFKLAINCTIILVYTSLLKNDIMVLPVTIYATLYTCLSFNTCSTKCLTWWKNFMQNEWWRKCIDEL